MISWQNIYFCVYSWIICWNWINVLFSSFLTINRKMRADIFKNTSKNLLINSWLSWTCSLVSGLSSRSRFVFVHVYSQITLSWFRRPREIVPEMIEYLQEFLKWVFKLGRRERKIIWVAICKTVQKLRKNHCSVHTKKYFGSRRQAKYLFWNKSLIHIRHHRSLYYISEKVNVGVFVNIGTRQFSPTYQSFTLFISTRILKSLVWKI